MATKSFKRLLFYFRILLRNNLLLGLYHIARKIVLNRIEYHYGFSQIQWVGLIDNSNKSDTVLEYFNNNKQEYKSLIKLADLFFEGKVIVYNHTVNYKDFRIEDLDLNNKKDQDYPNDIRFYWELYRSKFVYHVGMAYSLTKNEKYANSLLDFINEIESYSPLYNKAISYNGMEASIKLINLSWIHYFMEGQITYETEYKTKLSEVLIDHANYIFKNYDITKYGLESNHGFSCSIGLIYASFLLPDYYKSDKWKKFGFRTLKRSLKNQFSKDGVNFESSTNYHRFVFEMLLVVFFVILNNSSKKNTTIEGRIKQIGNALLKLRHRNYYIPRIGDSDGGKFLPDLFSRHEFNSLEYLDSLSGKNKLFFETLIFGKDNYFSNFLSSDSTSCRIGNYLNFSNSDLSIICTANNIGTNGKGNHQHNDFLSFEIFSRVPFIVDPWSYCYTGNIKLRNNDRSTTRHNTLVLDNREIVEFDVNRLFEFTGNLNVEILNAEDSPKSSCCLCWHDGYKNLKNGAQIHHRRIKFDKLANIIEINDQLTGMGNHKASLSIYIPRDLWKMDRNKECYVFYNDDEEYEISGDWMFTEVGDDNISDLFLSMKPAYHLLLEKEYKKNTELRLIVKYKSTFIN